jgi:ABC-type nitrate/sulfonate/bicarbonate transport system ATPase subunit
VTHDVEEALVLATKIVVLSARADSGAALILTVIERMTTARAAPPDEEEIIRAIATIAKLVAGAPADSPGRLLGWDQKSCPFGRLAIIGLRQLSV